MKRNRNKMVGRANLVGHRMAGGRFMSGIEHAGTGGAYRGMSPDTFVNGRIASVHYPTPAGPRNMPRSPLSQHFAEGGEVVPVQPATITNIPEGGYARDNIGLYSNPYRASVYGGPLSYNQGTNQQQVSDYHTLADSRKNLRTSLEGTNDQNQAVLAAADALQRQSNDNPFGYNDRQTAALDLAWESSPDKVALEAENAQRAKEGKSPIQSDYGLNRYHVNPDGSRDYNYSADGQYRGAIPDEFRNEPGNPNTHDAHFNRETGKWEAGDLSLTQTFKDIGSGLYDAYGNIKSTIPLIGKEVISGVKDLGGNFSGGNAISGGGKDGVGEYGAVGDFFGGIGDSLGITNYAAEAAAAKAKSDAAAAAAAAAAKSNKQSAGSKALADATRAQLSKTNAFSAANKSKSTQYSGGSGYYMMGGPVSGHYQDGGFVVMPNEDKDDDEKRRRERAARAANTQAGSAGGGQGALGQFGSQVKNKLIGTAASMATKALFGFQDGGQVPADSQQSPLQTVALALRGGEITPEQAVEALQGMGVPPQQIQQVIASASTPQTGPLAPQKPAGGPEDALIDNIASKLNQGTGGPELPSQQFKDGGSVMGHGKMMAMPTAGPLSGIKTKSVNGYNTEEMSMSFDGKAASVPMRA